MQTFEFPQSTVKETSETPVIVTESLSKQFKKKLAVNQVDLEVFKGDIFGLLGPNGAGKTTIIRMLLGLIRPTAGRVKIFGFDVQQEKSLVLARTNALIEGPAMYPFLSGRENLEALALTLPNFKPAKIEELLELVGLKERAKDKYSTYSLGMKQRLGLAGVLLNDPQLIILDEPTNGLDPAGIAEIRQLVKDLAAQGRTIFISSHLLSEIQQICNRVAIIQNGQIIRQGLVTDLLAEFSEIRVRVPDEQYGLAWDILEAKGWKLHRQEPYIVVKAELQAGSQINQALSSANIFASEIFNYTQNLEDFYLSVTGSKTNTNFSLEEKIK